MLVATVISSPRTATPAPTQNSHQIGPPWPKTIAIPPTTKPITMMATATQETVRPWYEGYGPAAAGPAGVGVTPPCPVGPPGTTDVSCIASSLCDLALPNAAPPAVPGSEWFDMALLLLRYLADVPIIVARPVGPLTIAPGTCRRSCYARWQDRSAQSRPSSRRLGKVRYLAYHGSRRVVTGRPGRQPDRRRASGEKRDASGRPVRRSARSATRRASNHRQGPAHWRGQDPAETASGRRAGQLD